MAHKQSKRRIEFPAFTFAMIALLAIMLLIGAAPLWSIWQQQDIGPGDKAMAASIKSYSVSTPLQLSWQPSLILKRGLIVVHNTKLKKTRRSRTTPAQGPRNLALRNAVFFLDNSATVRQAKVNRGDEPRDIMAPLIGALTKFGFDTLDIERGTLIIQSATGKRRTKISNISARLTHSYSGQLFAKGSFEFKGETIKFDSTLDYNARTAKNPLVPFSFDLKNKFLTSSFKGRLSLANGSQIQGDMTLSINNLRHVAKWLIKGFPDGPALKAFSAKGPINMIGNTFSFENAEFELDGNKASGGLTLNLEQRRPLFEGTLAAKDLDLTPYFMPQLKFGKLLLSQPKSQNASQSGGGDASRRKQSALSASTAAISMPNAFTTSSSNFLKPSFRYFDADVRLSAQTIQLGDIQTVNAAMAMSLRDGKLLADIADIEFEGGRGIGQLTADMSKQVPRFAIRGRLDNVEVSQFISSTADHAALQGVGQLILKLHSKGISLHQLTRNLSGKLNLALPEGGTIGINPHAMFNAAGKAGFKGWNDVRARTPMQTIDVKFIGKNGVFNIAALTATPQHEPISCIGKIDLSKKQLDLRVILGEHSKDDSIGKLHVRGAWSSPNIWLHEIK